MTSSAAGGDDGNPSGGVERQKEVLRERLAAATIETSPLFPPRLEGGPVRMPFEAGPAVDVYPELMRSICGATDDSQPVELYDGTLGVTREFVDDHQRSVGQLQWLADLGERYNNPGNVSGVRWGSGAMISDDLFLSAGHCFDQDADGWELPRDNATGAVIEPDEIARNMQVVFEYQLDANGTLRPGTSFAVEALVEHNLGGLDFAICRVAGSPGAQFGTCELSSTDAAVGDMLCIIGHPAGQPKRVEAGPATAVSGTAVRYDDIDTLGGNSGSLILRDMDGRAIGIHTNGGCNAQGTGSNFGLRISSAAGASATIAGLQV